MSAKEEDRARTLAERIANRLAHQTQPDARSAADAAGNASASVGHELAALRATVSEIGQRLTQIESRVTSRQDSAARPSAGSGGGDHMRGSQPQQQQQQSSQTRAPQNERAPSSSQADANPQRWLSGTYVPAVHPSEERFGIDEAVSELVEFFEREKVCNVEPGGKPCDHCGMCSSRGF